LIKEVEKRFIERCLSCRELALKSPPKEALSLECRTDRLSICWEETKQLMTVHIKESNLRV